MPEPSGQPRTLCYRSSPEHVHSFTGRFIWIYTDKGQLSLTNSTLRFEGKNAPLIEIPLASIKEISVGRYSRLAKPTGLDYMAVRYGAGDTTQTILLTPTRSWTTPTWETNKIVAAWVGLVNAARSRQA
jgi:hypothetical protein